MFRRFRAIVVLLMLCMGALLGCSSRTIWLVRRGSTPRWIAQNSTIESAYKEACELEKAGLESCVDAFYTVACRTLPGIADHTDSRVCELHYSALAKLVTNAQKFCRYYPGRGIQLSGSTGYDYVPFHMNGFVWKPEDFHKLEPVGFYLDSTFSNRQVSPGVGMPVVVTRVGRDDTYLLPKRSHFDATIRLSRAGAIEFYDPHRVSYIELGNGTQPINRDTTASLVAAKRGQNQTALQDFLQPLGMETETRLFALEPHQPGKIPIVFVHGLLSSPFAWANTINELRAKPGINERFQIWVFEYPTGQSFLASAASLREQLFLARKNLDPEYSDPCFSQMILVGHSMGGLLAKLQITCSGEQLWKAVANRPFGDVKMDSNTSRRLAMSFFFQPSPDVKHVVFIGTPHCGSSYARRLIGRVGSSLVSQSEEALQAHRDLIARNPGVFNDEVSKRIPTSIDLLEPSSDLLNAIRRLPIKSDTRLYSIVGDATWTLKLERSDGVVPISSARHENTLVEYPVNVRHSKLNSHLDSICALEKILGEHVVFD